MKIPTKIAVSGTINLTGLKKSQIELVVSDYKGHELSWAWELVNKQGYSDGLKLQFKNQNKPIEFIAEASSINNILYQGHSALRPSNNERNN